MPEGGRAGSGYIEIRPELAPGFVGDLNRQVAAGLARVKGDVKVGVDQSHLAAGIGGAESKFSGHFAKLGGMAKTAGAAIATGLAAGGALAVAGVGKIGYDAVQAASDVGESQSKNVVLFGDSAKAIEDWAKTTATSLGISRSEALSFTGTFGNLFRPMGIAEGQAADMSRSLVTLAGDMASFNNANPEEVLDALRAGLVGETEPLRRFGVMLDEATLKQTAYANGIAKVGEDLTPAQKAQAAYAAIFKQTALQQGDAERTSGSFANKQRQVAKQFEDLKANIGEKLLPVAEKFTAWMSTSLMPLFDRIVADGGPLDMFLGWIDCLVSAFQMFGFSGFMEELSGLASELWTGVVQPALASLWASVSAWLVENGPAIAETAKQWGMKLIEWAYALGGALLERLGPLLTQIGEWVQNVAVPYIETHWQEWVSAFLGWFGPVWVEFQKKSAEFLLNVGKWIITDALPWLWTKTMEWTKAFVSWLDGAIRDLPGKLLEWLGAIGKWITETGIPTLVNVGRNLFDAFVQWLSDLPGKAAEAGGNLISGLWEGLKSKLGEILNGIGGLAKPLVDAFKSAFGIQSPAKVMMPIGEQIAAGIAQGFAGYDLASALSAQASANLIVGGGIRVPPPTMPAPTYAPVGAASGLSIVNNVHSGADAAEVAQLVTAQTVWRMQRA